MTQSQLWVLAVRVTIVAVRLVLAVLISLIYPCQVRRVSI